MNEFFFIWSLCSLYRLIGVKSVKSSAKLQNDHREYLIGMRGGKIIRGKNKRLHFVTSLL
jgi:hypothetical protein